MSNGNHLNFLNRLRKINISRKVVKVDQVIKDEIVEDKLRNLNHKKLEKIIELYISDPLTWDNYTLSRIYKVQNDQLASLIRYVRPMVHYTGSDVDTTKLVKTSLVVDISRFKRDKNYFPLYQRLIFPINPKVQLVVE